MDPEPKALRVTTYLTTVIVLLGCVAAFFWWWTHREAEGPGRLPASTPAPATVPIAPSGLAPTGPIPPR